MKSFLVMFVLGFSHFASADCGNLSGSYSSGNVDHLGREFVATLVQDGCKTIAIGSYSLSDGEVSEVVEPEIRYVAAGSESLCELKSCTVFEGISNGITFVRSSSISVKGTSCSYSKVEWILDGSDNLVQRYILNDTKAVCKKHGVFSKTLNRVQ